MEKTKYSIDIISFDNEELGNLKIHKFTSKKIYFVNSAIIETKNNLIIYDAQQDDIYGNILLNYAHQLNKPIKMIILGHPHIDHYGGLGVFKEVGIASYSSKEVIEDAQARELEERYIPEHVIDKSFEVDGIHFEVDNIVNSHCPNHIILWIKELKTILVGDLAQYNGHLLAYDYNGFIVGLEFINQKAKDNGYSTLITGHGNVTTVLTLEENINYLMACRDIYLASKSADEFDKAVINKFLTRSKIRANMSLLLKDKNFQH